MTRASSGDKFTLVAAGVATDAQWRGGRGICACSVAGSISSAELQISIDGNWVDVKDINGNAITYTTTSGMFNFELPAGTIRMNGVVTGATVTVIGI